MLKTCRGSSPDCPSVHPSGRAQIGDTTDDLNRLEGDLTIVQDSNSDASKELSVLEREARELNLTSEQMHRQLDVLKNSNFLGEWAPLRSPIQIFDLPTFF